MGAPLIEREHSQKLVVRQILAIYWDQLEGHLDRGFADPDMEALRQKLNEMILNG